MYIGQALARGHEAVCIMPTSRPHLGVSPRGTDIVAGPGGHIKPALVRTTTRTTWTRSGLAYLSTPRGGLLWTGGLVRVITNFLVVVPLQARGTGHFVSDSSVVTLDK